MTLSLSNNIMINKKIYCYLFLLIFSELALQIKSSFHGHNNGFVQDDNEVQYILDNIPIPMHQEFANTLHGPGDISTDKNIQNTLPYIKFEPDILDFKDRQLGVPHRQTVLLINKDHNRTIYLTSISGSTQHFHSSFFQDKVIPPLGNTTFNVIFLGREEGEVDSYLYIRTSDGILKYKVRGLSTSSPYRLHPVVGVKLPLNASFMPFIHMHNPHAEPIQVTEVYSSGSEFQLELPSGEAEGSRELWEIAPYQTKPVIRLHFNAFIEKNHTAYVRFKINNSVEVMIVAVEVEVKSGAGLHWGENSAWINLGIGGSLQPPIHYPIVLKNSAKKAIKVLNVISTPVSKALMIDFEPTIIPGDTDTPVTIGTLIYDWKIGLDINHFKGKLLIKGLGPGGSTQKLSVPWNAQVLQGGLEVNSTVTHYFSSFKNQPRNFSVVNKFNFPLAITNVTLADDAKSYFEIKNFVPRVLKAGQKCNIFVLISNNRKNNNNNNNNNFINSKLESSIIIYSNVSTIKVPLLSYDGKVKKIIPRERENDRGIMNFGTVSSGTENEAIFALENINPISIELHGWGVNMPGAVLELMGCKNNPIDLFNKPINNIAVCSHTGSQSIKPGYLAIFKIRVKTSIVDEDTIVGDVFVKTIYERLTIPVYMQVAHGKILIKKFTFTDCFPGSICTQQFNIHSTFSRSMKITLIEPIQRDMRVKYFPPNNKSLLMINKGDNNAGTIGIDLSVLCKQHCYLGLSINSTIGNQWMNTMSLPSHTRDSDLNLLITRYNKYLNSSGIGGMWNNITMRLDTTEVREHQFFIDMKPYWPSLVLNMNDKYKNKSNFTFSLTQVGNTSFKTIKIYNPSTKPLIIQLTMDWSYPQGTRLYHLLPNMFKSTCYDCPSTIDGEFKIIEDVKERKLFEKNWDINVASDSLPFLLNPKESRTIKLSYTPSLPILSSGLLFIRNNLTILQVIRLTGRGAHAQFKFGNRKSGSNVPLLFELTEKHLKGCEQEQLEKNSIPNLTVKRSFTARNSGELPIDIYGFYINGLNCEGYGFKVLNCESFKLNPNATKKIEIAFTPDFTLSKIERKLSILTSIGSNFQDSEIKNGIIELSLLTTLPSNILEICSNILIRPTWERSIQWAAISLSCILLICILVVSFLEADRILRNALLIMSKTNGVQPPLDLRHLVTQQNSNRERIIDEKINSKKKDEPDWNLMNVKKIKDKDVKGYIKIPDWSAEEERKFKMEIEIKDITKLDDLLDNDNSTLICRKKKKQIDINDNNDLDQEKRSLSYNKSSPKINNKIKRDDNDHNLLNNEVKDKKKIQHNIGNNYNLSNSTYNNNNNNSNNNSNNNNNNNNNSYKKYEANVSQKVVHYLEEDTSSTTTESSIQEESTFKDQTFHKLDKVSKKSDGKINKQAQNFVSNVIDFRDNYEGDCDDDDYEKERQDNFNRWKMNTNKSVTKNNCQQIKNNNNNNYENNINHKTGKLKNIPKKDKQLQKRRISEKNNKLNINFEPKSELKNFTQASSSIAPPPPPTRWGENRAKFSDVVARNPDSLTQSYLTTGKLSSIKCNENNNTSEDLKMDPNKRSNENWKLNADYSSSVIKSNIDNNFSSILENRKFYRNSESASSNHHHHHHHRHYHHHQHDQNLHRISNSYFINSFEQAYEPDELIPYDDLPETDEPLMELESIEKESRLPLWNDKTSMTNLLTETNSFSNLGTINDVDKLANNLTDSLKDSWLTVETNWEPLYSRGAVGEERSGVWGINTGGVWAAAPWGTPTPPILQMPPVQQSEQDIQEHSGFDPFRSLSTIWTPSTSWDTKQEK